MQDAKALARSRSAMATKRLRKVRQQVNADLLALLPKSKRGRIAKALREVR